MISTPTLPISNLSLLLLPPFYFKKSCAGLEISLVRWMFLGLGLGKKSAIHKFDWIYNKGILSASSEPRTL